MADRPLSGVRVLDFTWVYAGPHATRTLAALGADVVKVETESRPDLVRNSWGYADFEPTENLNVSAYFNEQNQGKRGITIDLTTGDGQEIALELAGAADVVMEAFSPTFMDRVDLTYEDVRSVNEEVIYLSMPGWATSGPAAGYRSFGLNLQSMAGMDAISGLPEDPPTTAGFSWPDPTAGYMAATVVSMALLHRLNAGEGTYIELPQYEATVSFLHKPIMEWTMNEHEARRVGNRDEDARFVQGAYPCASDDRWAVIAIETDEQWARLCSAMGVPDLATDDAFDSHYNRLRNQDELDEIVAEWTRRRSREEVRDRLQARGIPAGIVADERDLLEYDPQLRVRDYFTTHDHPDVGERRFQGVPFDMAACDVQFDSRAPLFGEHTDEVLADWLGYSADEIEAKRDALR